MGEMPRDLTVRLIESNEEYRRLSEQHSDYDRRLEELTSRRFPTPEEQLEEMRLKKLKLHLKDRMHEIQRHYQEQAS
jgi:uncharacterized protein YdcH (DUF465 family)